MKPKIITNSQLLDRLHKAAKTANCKRFANSICSAMPMFWRMHFSEVYEDRGKVYFEFIVQNRSYFIEIDYYRVSLLNENSEVLESTILSKNKMFKKIFVDFEKKIDKNLLM